MPNLARNGTRTAARYIGPACRTCGSTERYVSSRACTACEYRHSKQLVLKRKRKVFARKVMEFGESY